MNKIFKKEFKLDKTLDKAVGSIKKPEVFLSESELKGVVGGRGGKPVTAGKKCINPA